MMFPRDTVLYVLAVAEYVTAIKSARPFADNHAMINRRQKVTSRRLKSSSKSSGDTVVEPPKAKCSFDPSSKSSKASKASKSSKSSNVFNQDDLEDLDEILMEAASTSDNGVLQSLLQALQKVVAAKPTCHTGNPVDVKAACIGCCTEADSCLWNGVATICDGACTGQEACDGIPANSVIMNGSCSGAEACENLGGDDGVGEFIPVFIGPGSCVDPVDDDVCSTMGASAETVVVSGASCKGDRACDELGERTTKNIIVGPRSCDGESACRRVAENVKNAAISIGSDSCKDYLGCGYMAQESTILTSIRIGDESCSGSRACSFVGYGTASTIAIGTKSCLGYKSCSFAGSKTATGISIGNGACDQAYACYSIGYEEATSVMVGDCACIGQDFKCNNFGYYFAGSVAVESGECASDAEVCCSDSEFTEPPAGQCDDICFAESCGSASDFTWSGTTTACTDICQA